MCNQQIIGPHNKKYCGSQEEKGTCAHKAGLANMRKSWLKKKAILKEKPCLMCGVMIEIRGSAKYCGNQRTPGTCSHEMALQNARNQKPKHIKHVPNDKLTVKDDIPVTPALTPRQQHILDTLKHNQKAAKLIVRNPY